MHSIPPAMAAILALGLTAACATAISVGDPAVPPFEPGEFWLDTDGQRIEAHAGGILRVGDTYYWYGEDHRLGSGNKTGISVYSSPNLHEWVNEGVAMPKDSFPEIFRDRGVAERPKVIRNPRTGQFVMWMHLDANRYQEASAGVAVSSSPTGPFRMVRVFRPIEFDYGYSPEESTLRERERGNSYRDMSLFQDDDGTAYAIYSSESNASLYAVRLNEDYTDIQRPAIQGESWERIIPQGRREAPAPFKFRDKYYLITSGLTGWNPNPAQYHVADRVLGPWKTLGNPAVGADSAVTFRSQSTFVLPVPQACERCFIYMGDRWSPGSLENSTYIWLPFVIADDGTIRIEWHDRWSLSTFGELQ